MHYMNQVMHYMELDVCQKIDYLIPYMVRGKWRFFFGGISRLLIGCFSEVNFLFKSLVHY